MRRAQPHHIQRTAVVRVMRLWLPATFRHRTYGPRSKPPISDGVADGRAGALALWMFRLPPLDGGLMALRECPRLLILLPRCNAMRLRGSGPVERPIVVKVGSSVCAHASFDALFTSAGAAGIKVASLLCCVALFAVHSRRQKGIISSSMSSNPDDALLDDAGVACRGAGAGRGAACWRGAGGWPWS